MKRWWIMIGIKKVFFFLLFGALVAYVVMMLWNWLMPSLFGLSIIGFWQALGILVLAKLFFGFGHGSWGYRGGYYGHSWGHYKHSMWREKMQEKLKSMTPEDRERFRQEWKQRCGRWGHYPFEDEKRDEPEVKTN